MNETIIDNWNSLVKDNDNVYVLGDFAIHSAPIIFFSRLKGNKHIIVGNHDGKETLKLPWNFVKDTYFLKYNEYQIWLSHYPHRSWPKSFHGSLHFFGHTHGSMPSFGKSCDVGVDCWNYAPVPIDTLINSIKDAPITDHHGRAD